MVEGQDLELAGGGSGLQGGMYMCSVRRVTCQLGDLLLPTPLPASPHWKVAPALGTGCMACMQGSATRD